MSSYYDDIVGLMDDFTDTIEIENYPRKKRNITFLCNDSENGFTENNKSCCCFYKYRHNLPHEHQVTSRAVQCGSGRLANCVNHKNRSQLNSNNHNVQQAHERTPDKSVENDMADFDSSKYNNIFQDYPPLLRESQKFRKSVDESICGTFSNLKKDEPYLLNDKSDGDGGDVISNSPNLSSIKDEHNEVNANNSIVFLNESLETRVLIGDRINQSVTVNNKETEEIDKSINDQNMCNISLPEKIRFDTSEKRCDAYKHNNQNGKKDIFYLAKPFVCRNDVRGRYCSVRSVQHKFFLAENANIESIIQDPSDRRIKANCDRYNCNIDVYSKIVKNGYRKNIIVVSAPNEDLLKKCIRSLDHTMNWCLTCQLNN